MQTQTAQEKLQNLMAKRTALNDKASQEKAKIALAKEELAKIEAEAKAKYGTSDIEELKTLLSRFEKENDAAIEKLETELNQMEAALTRVKQGFDVTASK
jgi:chromosome segregation ATPase